MMLSEYGAHRVLDPPGELPQGARRVDNRPTCLANEILLAVHTLKVDSASFRQLSEAAGGDPAGIARRVEAIVDDQGKLRNPVTGSGGICLGRVKAVGRQHPAHGDLTPGSDVASLVSLSLTPLHIDRVVGVDVDKARVRITGHAVLFARTLWARLPADLPEEAALSAFDVCGAPATVAQLARLGETVTVLGAAGKAGLLSCAAARRTVGPGGRVIGVEYSPAGRERLAAAGCCDVVVEADATRALAVREAVLATNDGAPSDRVISCVNTPGAEMAAILSCRDSGSICFFSMATSFTRAALGAEGVASPVTMLIGNGYAPGHAEYALGLLRGDPALLRIFLSL